MFSIDPENGNVIIARQLDWETRSRYNLTIMATDGIHRAYTEVSDVAMHSMSDLLEHVVLTEHRAFFHNLAYIFGESEDVTSCTKQLQIFTDCPTT